MKQLGLADLRLMKRTQQKRQAVFLDEMNAIFLWTRLIEQIVQKYGGDYNEIYRCPGEI